MRQLWGIIDFIRGAHTRLRFGELSRAPLKLIRFHWEGGAVQCDWLARSPDPWDKHLSEQVRDSNASVQALEDAMAIRELLFGELREVQQADLRALRNYRGGKSELIIAGRVSRDAVPKGEVVSLAMRAKLSGLQFCLEDGVLKALEVEAVAISDS
jgi:hypothetical protein